MDSPVTIKNIEYAIVERAWDEGLLLLLLFVIIENLQFLISFVVIIL